MRTRAPLSWCSSNTSHMHQPLQDDFSVKGQEEIEKFVAEFVILSSENKDGVSVTEELDHLDDHGLNLLHYMR